LSAIVSQGDADENLSLYYWYKYAEEIKRRGVMNAVSSIHKLFALQNRHG
jgi:hypothetical protein